MCLLALLISGCNTTDKVFEPQEDFDSGNTYSRRFEATTVKTCEASRRALLSQGYVVNAVSTEQVEGNKNFQPEPEVHLKMTIRVVCVPEGTDGKMSRAFVTAQQDRYVLKKTNNSASLGVSVIGSVSVPFMSGSDSLVLVGSETIVSREFYGSFFNLVKEYLISDPAMIDQAQAD